MATKKPSKPAPKTTPKKLQNLAAAPPSFDDTIDEQLVDHSGVFRVTSAIQKEQIGHDEDASPRFANDSLVMRAQADGFPDDGPTLNDALGDEIAVDDETSLATKRQRLATLAALASQKKKRR